MKRWWILLMAGCATAGDAVQEPAPPNVVLIFADDLGYGDLGCTGAKGYETPHLDRMASEGMRFTSFLVAQAVCSASRASLLTGCYNGRIGIQGALFPRNTHGIHADETTIAEVCRSRGYATGMVGKWHLGHHEKFLPLQHGFDEYLGLPYSNDMWPVHPTLKDMPPLPLIDGNKTVATITDQAGQDSLTGRYTERATDFIRRHRDRPFFLYVAHTMPHVPLGASAAFRGKSARGLYGDVIQELDAGVGRIFETLKECGLDERTLVIFTSDNGPWLIKKEDGGSAGPLREGKGTAWEGGIRVPCIARWPGRIPRGRLCTEVAATIDVLPTVARLVGAEPPKLPIDGKNIWPLMEGNPRAKSPHEAYYCYWNTELQAVRSGKWKLHFPHEWTSPGAGKKRTGLALYDLDADVGETIDVSGANPDVVARLEALGERARADLGDSLTGRKGAGVRAAGQFP